MYCSIRLDVICLTKTLSITFKFSLTKVEEMTVVLSKITPCLYNKKINKVFFELRDMIDGSQEKR